MYYLADCPALSAEQAGSERGLEALMPTENASVKIIQTALKWQATVVVCVGIGALLSWRTDAVPLSYGGMVAIMVNFWLLWRVRSVERKLNLDAQGSLRHLNITSIGRFALATILLALPLTKPHHWHYAWVIAGFAAGQITGLIGLMLGQMGRNEI